MIDRYGVIADLDVAGAALERIQARINGHTLPGTAIHDGLVRALDAIDDAIDELGGSSPASYAAAVREAFCPTCGARPGLNCTGPPVDETIVWPPHAERMRFLARLRVLMLAYRLRSQLPHRASEGREPVHVLGGPAVRPDSAHDPPARRCSSDSSGARGGRGNDA